MNIELSQEHHNLNLSGDYSTYHLPIASATTLGGVKVGNNLSITSDGTLSATSTEYELPAATSSVLGGVKIGSGLSMSLTDVLSVTVDSTLSSTSTNPLQNRVIYTNINSINNDITALDNRLTDDETTIGNHTSSLTTLSGTVDDLSDDLDTLSSTVSTNTSNISANTLNISTNTTDIGLLDGRLTTAEGTITDLVNGSSELSSDVTALKTSSDTDIEYSYLLPVSTWTSGAITVSRRGNIAVITFNIAGTYTLQSQVDSQIYQLPDTLENSVPTSGVLISDAGAIEVKVDSSRNIKFYNHDTTAKNITVIKGQLTVVL